MTRPVVTVINRTVGPIAGYTVVNAVVDGGDTGHYVIADRLIGTHEEVAEILTQSAVRQELRAATQAGQE